MFDNLSLVTITLFIPLVGFTILLFLPSAQKEQVKWTALGTSIVTLLFCLLMWANFDPNVAGLQMTHRFNWLSLSLGGNAIVSDYFVGVDGLSMLLVLLTGVIMPVSILFSFGSNIFAERGREKLYYMFLLLLQWAMMGVFVVQDLIIFYIFWEVTLVPMYFLIGIWGGERRVYAAIKFFLYTMAGSILMLLAILYVGNAAGTFVLPDIIAKVTAPDWTWAMPGIASASSVTGPLLFFGFFIAFAIKVPIWPFHSWLPDAHVQAPTAGSIILAGVLLKLGTYGLVRFNLGIFPRESAQFAPVIAVLAVIGIIYGAWVSYAQTDLKKLVAYTSVSHLGFVVLGIFSLNAQGIQGATLQMVNHGITTGGLFLIVGILYERYHTKDMAAYGGVWKIAPIFGGVALLISLASMGLPGLNGFVGEFTILMGSLGSRYLGFFFTLFAMLGVIMAAIYTLYMFQRIFQGDFKAPAHDDHGHGALAADTHGHGEDLSYRLNLKWGEIAALVPIVVLAIWIGLQPNPFFRVMDASTNQLVSHIETTNSAIVEMPQTEQEAAILTGDADPATGANN